MFISLGNIKLAHIHKRSFARSVSKVRIVHAFLQKKNGTNRNKKSRKPKWKDWDNLITTGHLKGLTPDDIASNYFLNQLPSSNKKNFNTSNRIWKRNFLHTISRKVRYEVELYGEHINVGNSCISKYTPQLCTKCVKLYVEKFSSSIVRTHTSKLVQFWWIFTKNDYVLT